jgi:hypothetical protein
MFLSIVSIAVSIEIILNFGASISSGRTDTNICSFTLPHGKKSREVRSGDRGGHFIHFHLQLQLSQSICLVAWHCKLSCEPVCVELATPSFWESVTHSFPSAQISLYFDWKLPPPAVQPHHSHEDGHCFSSYKCIPVVQSCQTPSISMLQEVDPYETVFVKVPWTLVHEFVFVCSVTQELFTMGDVISENCGAWR